MFLNGEIRNGKDDAYPAPFHEQPITSVVTAAPGEL